MVLLGTYNWAGAVTFTGVVFAVAACLLSFHQHLPWAMVCLMGCGLCDLFDGWVARRIHRTDSEAQFGLQLDSIADMAAFGLTPAIVLMNSGFDGWIDGVIFGFYACAAAMRLAHFNQSHNNTAAVPRHYTGLPVTYAALIVPVAVWAVLWVLPSLVHAVVRVVVIVTAWLFISTIKVPKPKGTAYGGFVLLAVAMMAGWLFFSP